MHATFQYFIELVIIVHCNAAEESNYINFSNELPS